jgi:hypothetical protein
MRLSSFVEAANTNAAAVRDRNLLKRNRVKEKCHEPVVRPLDVDNLVAIIGPAG